MNRVLVIEDEEIIRKQIILLLERNGYEVCGAGTIEEALASDPESFDVVLADIRLPGESGTEIIKHCGQVPVIVMTSFASVRSAVDSMKLGAVNYVSKPFDHDELLLVLARSLHENRMSSQNAAMKKDLERVFPLNEISVENPLMKTLVERLQKLTDDDLFVFFDGERGSGKELLARYSHAEGSRQAGPLVLADLPQLQAEQIESQLFGSSVSPAAGDGGSAARHGLLQAAHGGTLVLRNVTLLPMQVQKRMFALSRENSREYGLLHNVRIVALASTAAEVCVKEGKLDEDFASLFNHHIHTVVPLRKRPEDLAPLANYYLQFFVKRYRKRKISLSTEAFNALRAYQWPGNITELKSVIERAVLMVETDELKPAHLGIGVINGKAEQTAFDLSLDAYFRYFVLKFQGQLSETELASKLGISRKALWERRQKMGLPRG